MCFIEGLTYLKIYLAEIILSMFCPDCVMTDSIPHITGLLILNSIQSSVVTNISTTKRATIWEFKLVYFFAKTSNA